MEKLDLTKNLNLLKVLLIHHVTQQKKSLTKHLHALKKSQFAAPPRTKKPNMAEYILTRPIQIGDVDYLIDDNGVLYEHNETCGIVGRYIDFNIQYP
jgi:hypothetical protein